MKKSKLFTILALGAMTLALTGCPGQPPVEEDTELNFMNEDFRQNYKEALSIQFDHIIGTDEESGEPVTEPKTFSVENPEDFDEISYDAENSIITLKPKYEGAKFTLSGYFEGQIVSATKNTVIKLGKVYIINKDGPAITSSKKMEISTESNTLSYVIGAGKAAILCDKNLELGGSGTCRITGTEQHGVKGDEVKLKGSGNYDIQGTKEGSAINSKTFITKEDATASLSVANSKNGIKADQSITINSCSIYLLYNDIGLKTDSAADDPEGSEIEHFIYVNRSSLIAKWKTPTGMLTDKWLPEEDPGEILSCNECPPLL